jgi:cytochrome c6
MPRSEELKAEAARSATCSIFERVRGPRLPTVGAAAFTAVALMGCARNGDEPAPPQEQQSRQDSSADGRAVFTERCSSCHTLAEADAAGTVGPNLDDVLPEAQRVEQKVRAGGGGMPAFAGQLSDDQIRAVADYVASAARK